MAAGSETGDADGDGFSNGKEYTAGTHPLDAASSFALGIVSSGQGVRIQFLARQTQGAGYTGLSRHYRVEAGSDPQGGPWQPLPGAGDILGADQAVSLEVPRTNAAPAFFRGRVELRSP